MCDLGHAAHLAAEEEAVVAVAALPALLGLLGDGVEALGDHVGDAVGLLGREQQLGVERAADRRLLDDEARIARVQLVDQPDDAARLLDDVAQIPARAHLAGARAPAPPPRDPRSTR